MMPWSQLPTLFQGSFFDTILSWFYLGLVLLADPFALEDVNLHMYGC
jgi:hypothetical protein